VFDLKQFPYDSQELPIKLIIWRGTEKDYERTWKVMEKDYPMDREFLQQPDFSIDFDNAKMKIISKRQADGKLDFTNLKVQFTIPITRIPWFYVFGATFPLIVIMGTCLAAFSLHPEDDRADRIGISVTLLLAAIAVKFVVAADIPRVPYCTILDLETLLSYLFLLTVTCLFALGTEESNKKMFQTTALVSGFMLLFVLKTPIKYWYDQVSTQDANVTELSSGGAN